MGTVLIKLGGSLITEKARPETARPGVIRRLAGEIARAAASGWQRGERGERLIVGHGSGSFGHTAAARYGLAGGLCSPGQLAGIAETQERAAALHWRVVGDLRAAGALPFSIAPSSCLVAAAGAAADLAVEPLSLALERGLLPVVYGDVVMDRRQGVAICSTEGVFEALARKLSGRGVAVSRALWLGETAGVWDRQGRILKHLSAGGGERELDGIFGPPAGTDVTGGMRHRVATALALARLGIPSLILDGRVPGLLERALAGEDVPGTAIVP